jgi:hypothetical protein
MVANTMTKIVGVLPFAYQPYARECTSSLGTELDLLCIDNTQNNLGVAGSWNQGIEYMKQEDADWLIIISAAMRFGSQGRDMLEQIQAHPSADIIRFAKKDVAERQFNCFDKADNPSYPEAFYWHCTAISRQVVEQVGKFDANFHPIYFEDTDYDLRIKKAGFKQTDIIVPIDAMSVGSGHAVEFVGIDSPSAPLVAYFAEKWGRHPGAHDLGEYPHPFNNPDNSLAFWPPARGETYE